jgi:hypothetical protein
MIALVLAMVVLQNAVPDAVVTPAASLGQSLTGKSDASPLGLGDSSAAFGDVTIEAGCTYGTPGLTSSGFENLSDLSRAVTMPECSGLTAFPVPMLVPVGTFARLSGYPIQLEPGLTGSATHPTFTTEYAPARSFVLEHLVVPSEFKVSAGPKTLAAPIAAHTATVVPPARVPIRR